MTALQVRCPDCGKRLFDLEPTARPAFKLLIVCRCKQRVRVEMHEDFESPLLARA
jgi:hypothetical protein